MQTEDSYFGKAFKYELATGVDFTMDPRFARFHRVVCTAATALTLAAGSDYDGHFVYFASDSSSTQNLTVDGWTIQPGEVAFFANVEGTWYTWNRNETLGGSASRGHLYSKTYIVGGTSTPISTKQYSYTTGVWTSGNNLLTQKVEAAAASVGPVASLVGYDPQTTGHSDEHDELNIVNNTVQAQTNFPVEELRACAAQGLSPALLRSRFFYGGNDSAAVFSFVNAEWSIQTSLPMKRGRGIAVSRASQNRQERNVYLFSGDDPIKQPCLGHHPRLGFYWTCTLHPGDQRRSVAGFARNDKLHQIGGYLDSPATSYSLNEEYDPLSESWATRTALPADRYGGAGVTGEKSGFYIGGRNAAGTGMTGTKTYKYDAWTVTGALPAAREEVRASGVSVS